MKESYFLRQKNRTCERLIYSRFIDGLCFFNNDEFENNDDMFTLMDRK